MIIFAVFLVWYLEDMRQREYKAFIEDPCAPWNVQHRMLEQQFEWFREQYAKGSV